MDLKWGNARPHGASLQHALLSLLFYWSTEDFYFPLAMNNWSKHHQQLFKISILEIHMLCNIMT